MRVLLTSTEDNQWERVPVGGQLRAYWDTPPSFTFIGISGETVVFRNEYGDIDRTTPRSFCYGIIVDESDSRIPA